MKMLVVICATFLISVCSVAYTQAASADWEDEFEEICSKVAAADDFSIGELQSLIDRSEKLLKKIGASDHRRKKIFIMRLKKCKSFYEFSLEVKQGG